MTAPRSKKDLLSKTAQDLLDEMIITYKYGRVKDIASKYMTKGLLVEDDSIFLYGNVKKSFFTKNEETFENEYIKGTPDLLTKDTVIDIKSSWDIFTFSKGNISKDYYWQLQGYMWLTGRRNAKLAYCLTDAPEDMIQDEMRRLSWKMNMIDSEDPLYIEAAEKLRLNMVFDDIPENERVKEFDIPFNEEDIEKLKAQIEVCREYLSARI